MIGNKCTKWQIINVFNEICGYQVFDRKKETNESKNFSPFFSPFLAERKFFSKYKFQYFLLPHSWSSIIRSITHITDREN